MANNSLSVVLAASCCNRNYLDSVLLGKSLNFRGRVYSWVRSVSMKDYILYCNDIAIGALHYDTFTLYKPFSSIIPSREFLLSLFAMFNLYPL